MLCQGGSSIFNYSITSAETPAAISRHTVPRINSFGVWRFVSTEAQNISAYTAAQPGIHFTPKKMHSSRPGPETLHECPLERTCSRRLNTMSMMTDMK